MDGVTSSIQTQIDSKQATITAGTNLSFDGNTLNTSAKPLSIIGSVDAVQNDATTNNVSTITFDKDSGFTVVSDGDDVTVGLGSHWKTLYAVSDGGQIGTTSSISPTGQEDLRLVAGSNIKLSLDNTEGSQKVKFELVATPTISTISNTGTLTLPTSTDTLVGRDTTDTLTSKTLTSPTINNGIIYVCIYLNSCRPQISKKTEGTINAITVNTLTSTNISGTLTGQFQVFKSRRRCLCQQPGYKFYFTKSG